MQVKKNYVISIYEANKNDAGSKAKSDIDKILAKDGFEVIYKGFNISHDIFGKIRKLKYKYLDIPKIVKSHTMDNIFINYPLYSSFLYNSLIANIRKYSDAKIYLIIHDIEALRLFSDNLDYIKAEMKTLNEVSGLIVHNTKMQTWLIKQGINVPIVNLEIFDYLNPQPLNTSCTELSSVCFAGNLEKSSFLQEITFPINIYGPNPKDNYPPCVTYMGQYLPDELPKHLTSAFGLVWDGAGIQKCDGVYGKYMRYNNPHKVSLYLSSGIPVIIWKKAALADFIVNNNLGFVVNNLNQVPEILSSLSKEQYELMKANVINVAKDLRQGKYTLKAINKMLKL